MKSVFLGRAFLALVPKRTVDIRHETRVLLLSMSHPYTASPSCHLHTYILCKSSKTRRKAALPKKANEEDDSDAGKKKRKEQEEEATKKGVGGVRSVAAAAAVAWKLSLTIYIL